MEPAVRSASSTPTRPPVATANLKDGTSVVLRPIRPEDKSLLVQGFHQLSPRARFLRFLAPADRLTPRQLAYFSELDFHDHVAWGVLRDGEPVGVARFVRLTEQPAEADVAVTVIDAYQHRGLGRLLLETLAVSARSRGIGVFHFDVLAENSAMLGLLKSLGAQRVPNGDIVHLLLPVAAIPPPPVEGDITWLLEDARRAAVAREEDQSSGSSSSAAEFTQ